MEQTHDQGPGGPAARRRWRGPVVGAALVAAGGLAGGLLAGSLSASAATTPTPTPGYGGTPPAGAHPRGGQPHAAETPLTGTTADKVKAAALAKHAGATVKALTTDGAGAYEADLLVAGKPVTEHVSKAFAVTGEDSGQPGGPGGHGRDGRGGARLSGTVVSTTASSVTIKLSDGTTKTYAVDAQSDVDKNGEAALSDLKAGDAVRFDVRPGTTATIGHLHAGDEALDRPQGGPRGGGPGGPRGPAGAPGGYGAPAPGGTGTTS